MFQNAYTVPLTEKLLLKQCALCYNEYDCGMYHAFVNWQNLFANSQMSCLGNSAKCDDKL